MKSIRPSFPARVEHHADSRRMEIRTLLKEIHGMSDEKLWLQEKDTAVAERLRQLDRLVHTARGVNMQLRECGELLKLYNHLKADGRITEND